MCIVPYCPGCFSEPAGSGSGTRHYKDKYNLPTLTALLINYSHSGSGSPVKASIKRRICGIYDLTMGDHPLVETHGARLRDVPPIEVGD